MSGICGIVRLDGGPVDAAEIQSMVELLKRRGPDGHQTWMGRGAAFGHTLLATTPEAAVEKLPLVHPESGCVIAADVRLDNRDELAAAIGMDLESRVVGDGELILQSYLKWGEDCPTHLLGDFAFAIWDQRRRRLFCARDQIGMRQLHYSHLPGRAFLFATEPGALLAHPLVPRQINQGRIADFLAHLEGFDLQQTFYKGVCRLPPARTLCLEKGGLSCEGYWSPRPQAELRLRSDEAYAEVFNEIFKVAVRRRLRSRGAIGSMLSGGLDSGSVAAVAAKELAASGRGPLKTFSAIGPHPATCPETRAISASIGMPGLEPILVNHAELDRYVDDLAHSLRTMEQPFEGWMTLLRAIYLAASRAEVKVVLDGVAADLTLGAGWTVAHRFRNFRLGEAVREARRQAAFWGRAWPTRQVLVSGLWRAYAPRWAREFRHDLITRLKGPAAGEESLISERFAEEVDLPERRRRWRRQIAVIDDISPLQRAHWAAHPYLVVARERYDRLASTQGIEPRDPFADLELIQFCSSLPAEQLQQDGWPKYVLRNAMAGNLPDSVRWRAGKEHLGRQFTSALFRQRPELDPGESIDLETEGVWRYVDKNLALKARQTGVNTNPLADWLDVVYLAMWLNSHGS